MVQSHRAPSSRRSLKVRTEFTTMVLANAYLFLNFDCLRQKMQAFPLHVYYKANPSDGIWVPCNGTISPRAQTQTGPSERALVSSLLYLPASCQGRFVSLPPQTGFKLERCRRGARSIVLCCILQCLVAETLSPPPQPSRQPPLSVAHLSRSCHWSKGNTKPHWNKLVGGKKNPCHCKIKFSREWRSTEIKDI